MRGVAGRGAGAGGRGGVGSSSSTTPVKCWKPTIAVDCRAQRASAGGGVPKLQLPSSPPKPRHSAGAFLFNSWGLGEAGLGGDVGLGASGGVGGVSKTLLGTNWMGEVSFSSCALGMVLCVGGRCWGLLWGCVPSLGLSWSCRVGVDLLEVSWGSRAWHLKRDNGVGPRPWPPTVGCTFTVGLGAEALSGPGVDGFPAPPDVSSGFWHLDTHAGGKATADCVPPVRCSRRLALTDAGSVLDKAITRKARMLAAPVSDSGKLSRGNCRRLMSKSLKCGVRLTGEEADSLAEFASTCG